MRNEIFVMTRWLITIFLIVAPVCLLKAGIFGFFLFTFSLPILWKILFNQPWQVLGMTRKNLLPSILTGLITGTLLGIVGGEILRFMGAAGYILGGQERLALNLGIFRWDFLLAEEPGYRLLSHSNTPGGLLIYFLFFIFIIGLGEELFWRGFVQKWFAQRMSNVMAIALTSLLFAMAHSYLFIIVPLKEGLFLLGLIALASGIWGFLFKYFDNLWGVALSHGLAAPILWKFYFFK